MASQTKSKDNKSAKRLRITLAVLYFIQVVLTTFPFLRGITEDGEFRQLTAFEIAVQPAGYPTAEDVQLAIFYGIFILFPMVAFFFCILDKNSNVKNFISVACSIFCMFRDDHFCDRSRADCDRRGDHIAFIYSDTVLIHNELFRFCQERVIL